MTPAAPQSLVRSVGVLAICARLADVERNPSVGRRAEVQATTPSQLANELVACRRRGLAYLDVPVGAHPPLVVPGIEYLATSYASDKRLPMNGRSFYISTLINDSLTEFGKPEPATAGLIRELFFGTELGIVATESPGELLMAAANRRGIPNDLSFRRQRKACFLRFSAFLVQYVNGRIRGTQDGTHARAVTTHSSDILAMVKNANAGQDEILARLREMSRGYQTDEVLDAIVRFDTPDVLD